MSKKRILMLSAGTPNQHNSGVGIACHHICNYLSKKSNLTIAQPSEIAELKPEEIKSTSEFSKKSIISIEKEIFSETIRHQIDSSLSIYGYDTVTTKNKTEKVFEKSTIKKELAIYTKEIIESVQNTSFDVIYAHDWISFQAGIELKKRFNIPLVLHVHSLEYDRNPFYENSWVYQLEKDALEAADGILCVSSYSKNIIQEEYGINNYKIKTIHLGHILTNFPKAENPFPEQLVLFVGRLTNQKGTHNLLSIAEKVFAKNPKTRFMIAGDGDIYETIISASAKSMVAENFHMTGYLEQDKLDQLYAMADVFCMPSLSEPFGLVALEAANAGLPMVLSENSGVSEIFSSANTVAPNDLDNFSKAILELLSNKKKSQQQIKKNKEVLTTLTWNSTGNEILNFLTSRS